MYSSLWKINCWPRVRVWELTNTYCRPRVRPVVSHLLTCHSLVSDTRGCQHMPLCAYIGRSSTNTYTRAHSSPFSLSGTRQLTAVCWLRPSTHECALLFALHSLYPDSGIRWFRIPADPNIEKSAVSRMLPDSELTAGSGFQTRIRHTPSSHYNYITTGI